MTQQPDLFVEADERKKPVSAYAAELIRKLPKGFSLSVMDIANAFEISPETVRGYIEEGILRRVRGPITKDKAKKKKKPRDTGKIIYLSACDLANKLFPAD